MLKRIFCAIGAFFILTASALAVTESFEAVSVNENRVFYDGMAAVKISGLWGYADSSDNLVIGCQYTEASPFSEGLAFVKDGLGWRCIDKTGQILFTLSCDAVYPFSDGIARFKRGEYYGFVDKNGQIITEAKWTDARDAKNGFIAVSEESLYGYIDYTGQFFINAQYDEAYDFTENAAYVVSGGIGQLISVEGEVIYTGVCSDICEGLAKISTTNESGATLYGFVNESGAVVIQPVWEDAGIPSGGKIAVKKDGKWGYIDFQGNTASEFIWDFAAPYQGGFARVAKLPDGETLPTSYVYSGYVPDFNYTYLNASGAPISETVTYKDARDFSDGRAAVYADGLWGFIDTLGAQVIPCIYESVSDFSSNSALVVLQGVYAITDDTGKLKVYYAAGEERPSDGKEVENTALKPFIKEQAQEDEKRGVVSYIAMGIAGFIILYSVLCAAVRLGMQSARKRRRPNRRKPTAAPAAVISSRRGTRD